MLALWYAGKVWASKPAAQPQLQEGPQIARYHCDTCGQDFRVAYTGSMLLPCPNCTPLFTAVEEAMQG